MGKLVHVGANVERNQPEAIQPTCLVFGWFSMTKCKGPHHDFDDFTTYDFTTFTASRLLIDLETDFCTVNIVSRSITSREVVKIVRSSVVKSSKS